MRCKNVENGCPWVGELGTLLNDHMQKCEYFLVPCTYDCQEGGTTRKLFSKDLCTHISMECPKRPYTCPKCKETGVYQKMNAVHVNECPKVRVNCTNLLCKSKVQRNNLASHRSQCQYERVPCKYAEVGCDERPMKKELQQHECDDQLHMHTAMQTILPLNKKIKQLQEENLRMKTGRAHTFRLTNYQKHKRDGDQFYSPAFYTSLTGYKMCISVYANGRSDSKGTHVSVFAYLMKGDNDDSLTWPFTGIVTFELLNQLEDKNHHTYYTLQFPADNEVSGRVLERERGWGYSKFISHTKLDYNSDKNCQYLKDDKLIFRVSVNVPDYKPWLECTT